MLRWILVAAVLLLEPRSSEACSCAVRDELVVPATGATGVPLDAHVFYRARGNEAFSLYRGDDIVPTRSEQRETARNITYELIPLTPLAPSTTYELRGGDELISRFTTGTTSRAPAPTAPVIADLSVLEIALAWGGANCVGDTARWIDLQMEPDASAVVHSFRWSAASYSGDHWLFADDLAKLTHGMENSCWFHRLLVDDGALRCVEVAARGINGQQSAYTRHCVTPSRCKGSDEIAFFARCREAPTAEPADWRRRAALYGLGLIVLALLTVLARRRRRG